jgi:hypothetical protein
MANMSVVAKTGVKREKGFLYFVDKRGDISCVPMRNLGMRGGVRKVVRVGVKKKPNKMYFVNKQGNICEVGMSRDGAKKKSKSKLAKPSIKYLVYLQKKGLNAVNRAKKILLAEKGRNFVISTPGKQSGEYGVVLSYEAKTSTQYRPTKKFVKLAGPASNVRIVNKVPKKYQ